MNLRPLMCTLYAVMHLGACSNKNEVLPADPPFAKIPTTQKLSTQFPEVSGIAPSFTQNGHLWMMQDGGNPTRISLVDRSASLVRHVFLKGITNRDWEDMIIMRNPGQNVTEIYIADIGNNNAVPQQPAIYRFREPASSTDTVQDITSILFTYPDGQHDAEAFLVDPVTMDIFILTKKESRSRIYRIRFPYAANGPAEFAGELPYNTVVSATSNQQGTEILVKTYAGIYYYKRAAGETLLQALLKTPESLAYQMELQGESICFGAENQGFYTIPEMPLQGDQLLSFYKRN
ncbi:MAG: hypothetical protein ABWZ25_04385 [Chitinophagaceae bacterium]